MIGLPPVCAHCFNEADEAGQLWRVADHVHLCKCCLTVGARWFGIVPRCDVVVLADRRPPASDMAAVPPGTYRSDDAGELRPVVPDAE